MTNELPHNVATTVQEPDAGTRPDGTDVSTTVVLEVAAADGIGPLAMEDTLNDWIDPDALNAVVRSMDEGSLAFMMRGHEVRVDADGTVIVDGPEPAVDAHYRS